MQFTTVIVALAGLAAAFPAESPLEKRDVSCALTNYPPPTEGPIHDGIGYLRGKQGAVCANGNQCTLVSCSYGTGISLCDSTGSENCHNWSELGDLTASAYSTCGGNPDASGGGAQFGAFQNFQSGFNVLVKGGYSC